MLIIIIVVVAVANNCLTLVGIYIHEHMKKIDLLTVFLVVYDRLKHFWSITEYIYIFVCVCETEREKEEKFVSNIKKNKKQAS